MSQEYSFTLTVPLAELNVAHDLMDELQVKFPFARVSRKTDRGENARFYLSFPFSNSRPDLAFLDWYQEKYPDHWDLFGPTYGRWGLA